MNDQNIATKEDLTEIGKILNALIDRVEAIEAHIFKKTSTEQFHQGLSGK